MFGFRCSQLFSIALLLTTTVNAAQSTLSIAATATTTTPFCADVQISQRQLRADGVEVTERYQERLYRTDTVVAFERVLPKKPTHGHSTNNTDEHQHAQHDNHGHVDQQVRRYEKRPNGELVYSLFDDRSKREIQLQPNEFAEFGFDGNFAALHALVDPALRPTLGRTDQTLRQDDRELVWSGRDQIVRSLQRRWPGGDYQLTVTPATSCADPRQSRPGYAIIDYADTLD